MSDGSHESFDRDDEAEGSSDRNFGLVFTTFFALVGLLPLIHGGKIRLWALPIAGAFLAVALLRPSLLKLLNRLWHRLGLLLHRIVNPLVMGLLFFLVVTPTAWVLRVLGKRPLALSFDRTRSSYWIWRHPPGPDSNSIRRQF